MDLDFPLYAQTVDLFLWADLIADLNASKNTLVNLSPTLR